MNCHTVGDFEVAGHLENPDIIRTTRQSDISGHQYTCAPFVKARNDCHPANISGTQFGDVGRDSSFGVEVRRLHVEYSYGEVRRGHQTTWTGPSGIVRVNTSSHFVAG